MEPARSEAVRSRLQEALSPTVLIVEDDSGGCGAKFTVTVVSTMFESVALLARHRMVNEALREEMRDIHALSIKALTPLQWEQRQQQK